MFETEDGRDLTEASTVPVLLVVGLRVRNYQNHRAGTDEAINDEHFEILFDDGDKAWRRMQMFEAEDGRELTAEASVAVPAAPSAVALAVGLRVRNCKNHRAGRVEAVSDKSCEITFDDGEKGWRYVELFEAEDGRELTAAVSVDVPAVPATVPVAVGLRVKNPTTGRCGVVTQAADGAGNFRVKFDDGDERARPIANFTTEQDGASLVEGAVVTSGEKEASWWSNDDATAWVAAESGGKKGGADRWSKDAGAGWEAAGAGIDKASDWQKAEPTWNATSNKADGWATGGWESSGGSGREAEAGKKDHRPSKWGGTDSWWQDTPGRGQQKGEKDTSSSWDAPRGRGSRSSTPTGRHEKRGATPTRGNQGRNDAAGTKKADVQKEAGESEATGIENADAQKEAGQSEATGTGNADAQQEAGESEATGTGQADMQQSASSAGSQDGTSLKGVVLAGPPGLELESSQPDESRVERSADMGAEATQGGSDVVLPVAEAADGAGSAQAEAAVGARSMGGDAPGDIDSEQLRALVEQADKYGAKVRELVKAKEDIKVAVKSCESKAQDDVATDEMEVAQVVPTSEVKDQDESCLAEVAPVSEMKDQEESTSVKAEPDSNETKDEGAAQEKVVPPDDSAALDESAASDELAHAGESRGDQEIPGDLAEPSISAEPRSGELKHEEPEVPEAQLNEAEPEAAATQTTFYELSPEHQKSEEPALAEEEPKRESEGKAAAEHDVAEAEGANQQKEEHGHEPVVSDAIDES